MKNKRLALPVTVLTVSVISAVLMVLFTTNFAFCVLTNREQGKEVRSKENIFVELAYKFEPNYTNLKSASSWYTSYNMLYCDAATEENGKNYYEFNELAKSESYREKCIKFQKAQINRENYPTPKIGSSPFDFAYPVYYDSEEWIFLRLTITGCDYAIALYANGDKEESMAVVEDLIERAKRLDEGKVYENGRASAGMRLVNLGSYIFVVHCNNETDKQFQNWMLEKEKEITTLAYNNMFDGKETENAFVEDVYYVPFK